MRFAIGVFRLAGIYGLLALFPMYFLEKQIAIDQPPAITHPEFFYGFVGVGVAWQLAFLVISTDPVRYRPLMLPSIVEKATFGSAAWILYMQQRVVGLTAAFATIDLALGVLFAMSFLATRGERPA